MLSYFIIVGSIFINSICQYLSPKITGAWNTSIADFKKYLMTALGIAGGLGVLAIIVSVILGEYILNLIYGNAYAVYEKELILIMCAGLALYLSTVLGYTLTAISHHQAAGILIFSIINFNAVRFIFVYSTVWTDRWHLYIDYQLYFSVPTCIFDDFLPFKR